MDLRTDAPVEPEQPVDGFFRYDLRVGTVLSAHPNEKARKPAYVLTIDFGPLGTRTTSAQLTKHYAPTDLVGRQVVSVLNFPPRKVADVLSQVLVLGGCPASDDVVLLAPDTPLPNGTRIA